MGRKSLGRERYNITMQPALVKRLDAVAESAGRTRSDVLQDAAEQYLDREERKRDQPKGRTK